MAKTKLLKVDTSAKRLKSLNEELKAKTGLDFEAYRNEETVATITDLLLFPKYAFVTVFFRLIILELAVVAVTLLLFYYDYTAFGLVFIVLGLILGIPNGLLWGLIRLVKRLAGDVSSIVGAGIELTKRVLLDMKELQLRKQNKELKIPGLGTIFQGVFLVAILPSVTKALASRLPLVGGLAAGALNRMMGSIFKYLMPTFDKAQAELDQEAEAAGTNEPLETRLTRFTEKGTKVLNQSHNLIGKAIQVSSRIGVLPFRIAWGVVGSISLLVIYIFWLLLG